MIWKLPQLFSPVTKRHVEQQVLYNTSINKLFHIIQNVNEYSQFLPLCTYSKIIPNTYRILHDTNNDQHKHEEIQYFEATLTVGIPPLLQETYTSAVYINTQQYSIETKSIHVQNHKFDQLSSYWKLSNYDITTSNNNSNANQENINPNNLQSDQLQHTSSTTTTTATTTHVYFMVEMTVSDPIISTTLDQLLQNVAQQQVAAFAQRCQQLQ